MCKRWMASVLRCGQANVLDCLARTEQGRPRPSRYAKGSPTPDSGTVELLGLNWKTGAKELRQRIGIQLQETQFPDKLTVEEMLRVFRSFYHRGIDIDESIKTAQLEEKRRSRIGGLSGGQKQRLAMATALVGDPELLFLDEPTTGLDPQARRHLWDLVDALKQSGRTIILTTHYMEEAERLCDRVAIMDHGKVIALGTPQGADCDCRRGRDCGVRGRRCAATATEAAHRDVAATLTAITGVKSHRVDASVPPALSGRAARDSAADLCFA